MCRAGSHLAAEQDNKHTMTLSIFFVTLNSANSQVRMKTLTEDQECDTVLTIKSKTDTELGL